MLYLWMYESEYFMTGISHLVARSPNASKNSDELKKQLLVRRAICNLFIIIIYFYSATPYNSWQNFK